MTRHVLFFFNRSFLPLAIAHQLGDVMWLRAGILGVVVSEKLRNATG